MNALRYLRTGVIALAALGLLATFGPVQRIVAQGMVNFTAMVGTEQISLNYPCTVSCFVTSSQLSALTQSQVGNNNENALVGGDATTNLFQRGASVVVASPANVAYTADRWFVWGGTNTPVTVASSTDAPANYGASFKVTKASGAGVVQVCVGQEVETLNSYRFQGQTAEFDVHLKALAGFSAASSDIALYIMTGTGADEGSSNGAFSLNAGGGSSTPWTGPTVLGGTTGYLIPITTSWARYTIAAPIKATTTEIIVAICYTPVGTGGATDGFEFTGAQLVPNAALATLAGANGANVSSSLGLAKSFLRRPQGQETDLQLRYSWLALSEAASTAMVYGSCSGTATTTAHCYFALPVQMRAVPATTFSTFTAGTLVADVETSGAADTVTGVALTASVNTVSGADITLTFAGSAVAGQTGWLRGGNSTGGGKILISSEL